MTKQLDLLEDLGDLCNDDVSELLKLYFDHTLALGMIAALKDENCIAEATVLRAEYMDKIYTRIVQAQRNKLRRSK